MTFNCILSVKVQDVSCFLSLGYASCKYFVILAIEVSHILCYCSSDILVYAADTFFRVRVEHGAISPDSFTLKMVTALYAET